MCYAKCVFMLFKLFGLASMNINFKLLKNTKAKNLFQFSYSGLLYNVILIFLLVIVAIYKVHNSHKSWIGTPSMNAALDLVGIIADYLAALIILFTFTLGQKTAIKIGNKLYSTRLVLEKFNLKYKDLQFVKHMKIICIFNLIIWCGLYGTGFICNVSLSDSIYVYLPNLIINLFFIQYIHVVIFVYGISKLINKEFKKITESSAAIIYFHKPQELCTNSTTLLKSVRFSTLRELNLFLYEISSDISNFYSFGILTAIIKYFYSVIFDTYCMISPMISGQHFITSSYDFWIILWLINAYFPMFILTQYVNITINEVQINRYKLFIPRISIILKILFVMLQIKRTRDAVHEVLRRSVNDSMTQQVIFMTFYFIL